MTAPRTGGIARRTMSRRRLLELGGITASCTLAALVRHIAPTEIARDVTVVQLMGNVGPKPDGIDGLEISHEVARRLKSTFYTVNAPAVVQDMGARGTLRAG